MPARLPQPVLPPADLPAPTPAPWSLDQTLRVLRDRRLTLLDTSRGLRVRHRHLHALPGLDAALEAYAPALRVWLHLGGLDARILAPWQAAGWDETTRLFAAWFELASEIPDTPFSLRPGECVTDYARFRAGLAARLADGPLAPGSARVKDDLLRLFLQFGWTVPQRMRRAWPMAA